MKRTYSEAGGVYRPLGRPKPSDIFVGKRQLDVQYNKNSRPNLNYNEAPSYAEIQAIEIPNFYEPETMSEWRARQPLRQWSDPGFVTSFGPNVPQPKQTDSEAKKKQLLIAADKQNTWRLNTFGTTSFHEYVKRRSPKIKWFKGTKLPDAPKYSWPTHMLAENEWEFLQRKKILDSYPKWKQQEIRKLYDI